MYKHYVLICDGKYYRADLSSLGNFFKDNNIENAEIFSIDDRYLEQKLRIMRNLTNESAYFQEVSVLILT